jgi:hypothetical protein
MPRILVRRARHPKTPGVSKICLSGSEPASASILSRRLDLENPWGLLSPVSPRPSPVSHRPSLVFNLQFSSGIFVPHPTAFVPQTTNQEHTPITSNYAREYPFLANENRQKIFVPGKEILKFFLLKNPLFHSSNLPMCKRANDSTHTRPTFQRQSFRTQSIITNRQSPIRAFVPQKRNSKKQIQIKSPPHAYTASPSF